MKAIVTVIGKDKTGIIASVSTELAKLDVNVEDISQTIMQDYFVMIMLVDTKKADITKLNSSLDALGKKIGVEIKAQHEDIFRSMHRI